MPPREPKRSSSRGTTLLVVEDEELLRRVLVYSLRRSGYSVLQAANGETGLAQWQAHRDRIKLVLLDLLMPVMDGETMLRSIREAGGEIPAIVITAWEDTEYLERVVALGGVQHVGKPYVIEQVLQMVGQAAGPAHGATG